MSKMGRALRAAGFRTVSIRYPSRKYGLNTLNQQYIVPPLKKILSASDRPVHAVSHSLGGILLQLASPFLPGDRIGRAVLLAPPNHGSEIVDTMKKYRWFKWFFGPAVLDLGTDRKILPDKLPPFPSPMGIIAGDYSIFPFFDNVLPGPHDGTVSVASTKTDRADAHLILHTSHPFIIRSPAVISQTIFFLKNGRFMRNPESPV